MATLPDWEKCNLELIKEACRHGEAQLAAQVQLATSADQRATVLSGIFIAAATGIIGAVATGDAFKHSVPLTVGASVTALSFLAAAVLCIMATLPTDFWTPGNLPSEWYVDIIKNKKIEAAVGEQAAHFDAHIIENNDVMERNARLFKSGALLGIASPILGVVAAGAIFLWGSASVEEVAAVEMALVPDGCHLFSQVVRVLVP